MPQSPIDIINAKPAKLPRLILRYPSFVPTIEHVGLTIQIDMPDEFDGRSFMQIEEKFYNLVQFHFHEPSEHYIEGKRFALEAHFVHFERESNNIAVVGIMIEEGPKNPLLEQISKALPNIKGDKKSLDETIDPLNLLPQKLGYYKFIGSLTMEPYLENVLWIIMKQPITASFQQIEVFSKVLKNNARPLQALKNRSILVCNNFEVGK